MSSKNPSLGITSVLLAALLCAIAAPALAQPNAEKPPARRPGGRELLRDRVQAGGLSAMQAGRFGFGFALERVLTEEQRTSLREAMEKQREKTRDYEEKLLAARRDLLKASIAEKFDEAAVRKTALAIGKLDAELTVLRAKAMSQMKPALTAEQIEKLKNPPPFEGGAFRPNLQRDEPRQNRRLPEAKDENDLPPKPKPEK